MEEDKETISPNDLVLRLSEKANNLIFQSMRILLANFAESESIRLKQQERF